MHQFHKIGLTGGVASGKSRVAHLFIQAGIPVIDMDKLSKTLLETDKDLQKAVIQEMGSEILTDHVIDRGKLRKLIFSNPIKKKALESLIHPRVRKEFERLAQIEKVQGKPLVICEAALLIEGGYKDTLDRLVVVLAPEKIRLKRLMERDHIDSHLAQHMLEAQVSDEERKKAASDIINNDGDEGHLVRQVHSLINSWKKQGLL